MTLGGGTGSVVWVHALPGQAERYNLTVAHDHTYAVGTGLWVVHIPAASLGLQISFNQVRLRAIRYQHEAQRRVFRSSHLRSTMQLTLLDMPPVAIRVEPWILDRRVTSLQIINRPIG